ncbi:MAG: hypothetical protein AAGU11_23840, partial [Syntrophobacteraceae bacterium]
MIVWRDNHGTRIAEVWFDEPAPGRGADLVRFIQRSHPVPKAECIEKHTLIVALDRAPAEIFSSFKKDTRNEIRRARDREGIICEGILPGKGWILEDFFAFHDKFASRKGLRSLDRSRLLLYASAGLLYLSRCRDPYGDVLAWHAYLALGGRARLLYSASHFRDSRENRRRNVIGRANRYLHWDDLLRFRSAGISLYDFGGWYAGNADENLLGINRFKEEFGGRRVCEFDCDLAATHRGRIAKWIARDFQGLKKRLGFHGHEG